VWEEVSGKHIGFENIDVATDYDGLLTLLKKHKPDAVVHFAEQRSAPYSMKTDRTKLYTFFNNNMGTANLLTGLVAADLLDTHVIHLGTMGVYGYGATGSAPIPEGYLPVKIATPEGEVTAEILHPTSPGSVYHLTKVEDQSMLAFFAKNDHLRVTDLHQGIVWGTQTPETSRDERLINRFDYDGDYGTVLNRFLMQAALGYPLTVHGTGGQTRAFIHIRDTVRCIEIALNNPPEISADTANRTRIFNQATETAKVEDLAEKVSRLFKVEVDHLPNPRNEVAENDLNVSNKKFLELGLNPTTLDEGLLGEVEEIAKKYKDRVDPDKIPARSTWTKFQKPSK
jgi:UDP-sulfoquinovose synthase